MVACGQLRGLSEAPKSVGKASRLKTLSIAVEPGVGSMAEAFSSPDAESRYATMRILFIEVMRPGSVALRLLVQKQHELSPSSPSQFWDQSSLKGRAWLA